MCIASLGTLSSCISLSAVADDGPGVGAGDLGAPDLASMLAMALGEGGDMMMYQREVCSNIQRRTDITLGDQAWCPKAVTSKCWNRKYAIHSTKSETHITTLHGHNLSNM